MTVRISLGVGAVLAVLFSADIPAAAASALTCDKIVKIARQMLKRHVLLRKIDRDIRLRVAEIYKKRIDPSRSLFLAREAAGIRNRFGGIFAGLVRGDCDRLERLHDIRRERVDYVAAYARRALARDDWNIDPTAEFIIDPKKRGHPKTPKERDALYAGLLQFRIANLLKTGTGLGAAKQRVIRHYERLARRIRELEPGDLYAALLDSVAKALDPHSAYLSADRLQDFSISSTLALEGIGATLRSQDGYTVIVRIIPGAPADRQGGLRPKDRIVAVGQDGETPVDVIEWSLRDVVRLIRGSKGTKVHLTVLREGETLETLQIPIVRDKIDLKQRAAKLRYLTIERDGEPLKLALIDLPSFYGNNRNPDARQSDTDVAGFLREAREQGARGVLLDLSRNAGGLLSQATKVAGLFLDGGAVVQVHDTQSGDRILRDGDENVVWTGPLVVLTSRRSASASEIVGAALQDHARAVIAGDGKTHGKGTVQTVTRLRRGLGAIKITTGFFFRPNGISTQNIGVESDVAIPAVFNTDGMGESTRPYTLPNRTIAALPELAASRAARPWKSVTRARIAQLVGRSRARVAASERFKRVAARIEAQRARIEKGVRRIAELLKGTPKPASRQGGGAATTDGKSAGTGAKAAAGDKPRKRLSIFQREALEILADHVALGG